jgi:hypothetical protein
MPSALRAPSTRPVRSARARTSGPRGRATLGGMTQPGDVLNHVVPPLVRLADRPGGALLKVASFGTGSFAILGLAHALAFDGWRAWLPLAFAALLAIPVAVLAMRRRRLRLQVDGMTVHRTVSANPREIVIVNGEPVGPSADSRAAYDAAVTESRIRTARFMPRVEAAQRAAVAAAGGHVHAPYLRDDLRITIAALVGTLAAIPLAALGSVVTALVLLAG